MWGQGLCKGRTRREKTQAEAARVHQDLGLMVQPAKNEVRMLGTQGR